MGSGASLERITSTLEKNKLHYSNNANKLEIQFTISLCYRHILIKPLDFYKQKHTSVDSNTLAKVTYVIMPSNIRLVPGVSR